MMSRSYSTSHKGQFAQVLRIDRQNLRVLLQFSRCLFWDSETVGLAPVGGGVQESLTVRMYSNLWAPIGICLLVLNSSYAMSTTAPFSFDEEVRLYTTNASREKYNLLATLFGIVVALDYLERAYVRDSITAAEYVIFLISIIPLGPSVFPLLCFTILSIWWDVMREDAEQTLCLLRRDIRRHVRGC